MPRYTFNDLWTTDCGNQIRGTMIGEILLLRDYYMISVHAAVLRSPRGLGNTHNRQIGIDPDIRKISQSHSSFPSA